MTANGHVYNPNSADAWKAEILARFLRVRSGTITGPVELGVLFYFPKPRRLQKIKGAIPHTVKPDTDNLLKAVMDAMTQAKIWKDDCQVFHPDTYKYYADGEPGAQIVVKTGY
jgi:Holliday junction resolvase RusA-like endonuclease